MMKKFLIVTALVWACLPLFAQHFTVDYTSQPQTYMNVYVYDAQIGGVDLTNGDEIAVFDGNICCGVFQVSGTFSGPEQIAAAKAEGAGTGYTAGHNIGIKIWDSSTSTEYNASVEFLNNSPYNVFTDNESAYTNISVKLQRTVSLTAEDKQYDATTNAVVGYTVSGGSVDGDVTITASNGQFDNKNVGTGKTVTGDITISGSDAGNYQFTKVETTTASISKKNLTVSNASASNKVYDGTTSASITGASLVGAISGDNVSIGNAVGSFSQKNVGTNISVTAAITLSGTSSGNYSLTQPTGLSANITKKTVNVYANDRSKDCNQNDPSLTYSVSPALVSGDSFSGHLTRESGEDLGEYDITQGTLSLSSNYTLVFHGATFTIRDEAPFWTTNSSALNRTISYSNLAAIAEAQELAPVADDNCDSDVSDIVKTSGAFVADAGCSEVGTYTNTWIVTDNSGNISPEYTQVITLVDDIAPVIQEVEDFDVVIPAGSCETLVNYPEILVDEACIASLELLSGQGAEASYATGDWEETWVAIDEAGNSDTMTFTISVVSENENPVIDAMENMHVTTTTQEINTVLTGIHGNACAAGELSLSAVADNDDLVSYLNIIYCGNNSKAILEIKLVQGVEGSSQITITVEDDQQRKTEEAFTLFVGATNSAPFLVTGAEDVEVNADKTESVYVSAVLGEYFDDADSNELTISVYEEGTNELPEWASFSNDSLTFQPTIADTGCVNIVVKAVDAEGLFATDTFAVCVLDYVLGANENGEKSANITIYPNPANTQLTVDLGGFNDKSDLMLFDIGGKMLIKETFRYTDKIELDLSNFEAGIYLVKTVVNGVSDTQKLVVKR
ncbi:YDG domain-containing protein [uncultured Draconibacterium sp.]|uniref:YDG domain-containing protein n=1 Tax=uncultured Draconibacterium sp. TaxID=1573823 RepID=UPI0029C7966A|nr:YDG domain-containing protein [uncultured Draconibacterium sp.]